MPELIPVLSRKDIRSLVRRMGRAISADFAGRKIVMIGVLKGSFVFMSDLIREISVPVCVDFIQAASYGDATETSGTVTILKDIETDIQGKAVFIVEDIVDTGLTLTQIIARLKERRPASIHVCAMIDKRERREVSLAVDYAGKTVDRGFLVGYGLDHAERYRELPAIYDLKL
ncbi:MAG: hypoxanthine phosphoribosyltransferase [Desulfobacterales bacterium]|nr:MAG: hypoxanthine phosphoribosyltransferase [Desulfobacterales bacterium]